MVDFNKIEKKWQNKWEKDKIFKAKPSKKKFYCLEMFPYPSGSGLHMGHAFNYTIGDIYARFKRMNNFSVLYPMGYDSLGLPAENAAIKAKKHPKVFTDNSINNFIQQQKALGLSYDWDRIIKTSDPEYYKWNQYFFLKFLENGLVYRKKAAVNWCPKCYTVLANEQVHNGKCWRHKDTEVEIKQLEQWFIKTTKYAEELLKEIPKLEWPERIKIMQKNWIGKSTGTLMNFKLEDENEDIPIFTTRPDTLYGVTFLVYAPEHPKVLELVKNTKYEPKVKKFINKVLLQDRYSRAAEEKEKEGMFIGKYAVNPLTNDKIPIYIANFVLPEYGTGIIMAVPAHDQRDFEFAKNYNIPIKIVIQPKDKELKELSRAYVDDGVLVNSKQFTGMDNKEAIQEITKYLTKQKIGKQEIQYKLKDWLISRQRYWGTPIPIVYCDKCGPVPVSEKDLPVKLPEKVKFGKGNPLTTNKNFINTKCPKCKKPAKRETDTIDTFFDSSWYFLRFCDPKNNKQPFDKKEIEHWMPVDQYIGGAEHACMHLIYARFFTKALRDLGFIKINEPFKKLFNQGMLQGTDGYKMSKSRGNVILPEQVSKKYGIDTARLFLVSLASPDKDIEWSDKGIEGSARFIKKIIYYFSKVKIGKSSKKTEHKINKAIRDVTKHIDQFEYNLAVIKLRDLFNSLEPEVGKDTLEKALKLLHPFCPHITEELWYNKLNKKSFISLENWPGFDPNKIDKKIEEQEIYISQIKSDIGIVLKLVKITPKKVYLYCIPNEKQILSEEKDNLETDFGLKFEIFAVNDKNIKDPQSKAKKAKPNKPAIYIE